ncbi:hypothetical protein FQU76_21940 [Streptomyces qinzhouensis]|uniref:Uncharacterized protein n=2 Tax=Streptomyces qinzhouensis TaxID=2599401 RepID=A0A5B8JTG8_9ACTN|nr:hypothetical protein FQU76_21940 [Streptomyces qinzhouensis]
MSDSGQSDNSVPSAGVSNLADAREQTERAAKELLDLIKIKGETSRGGVRITECGDGRDPEKHFQTYHPSSFYPESPDQLAGVMERLRTELPALGWKIVEYGPDTSRNKNVNLTADNDAQSFSVNIVHKAKNERPNLSLRVVSGCYQVPEGERVDGY